MERGPGYIEYDAINGVDQYNRRGPSRTWNKVWIVANPAIHSHPLIAHLRAKFSAVVRNGTAAEDFAFLLADEETHRSTERLRSRYRYHDWFNGRTFASDAAGLQQAREACYALESNSDLNSSELVRELTSRSREFFLW